MSRISKKCLFELSLASLVACGLQAEEATVGDLHPEESYLSTETRQTLSAIESITGVAAPTQNLPTTAEHEEKPVEHPETSSAETPQVAPAQTEQETQITQSKTFSDIDFSDIDNLEEQDSGNWYIKRVLLKKAGPKHNKIRQKVAALSDLKNIFFEKKAEEEKIITSFYENLGFKRDDVTNEVNETDKELESLRLKEGLTNQERQVIDDLIKKKKDLELLDADFKVLDESDATFSEAIKKLLEQIDVARGYEAKAWKYYEGIADVLDDQKARSYYQQIEVLLDNVEAIEKYIDSQFTPYIDQSIENIKNLTAKITQTVEDLRAKGIELNRDRAAEKAEAERRAALERERAQKAKAVSKGWFSTIFSVIGDFFKSIWDVITWPFRKLFGLFYSSKPAVKKVASAVADLKSTTT